MKFSLKIFFVSILLLSLAAKSQANNDSIFASIQNFLYENPDSAISETKKLITTEQNLDKKIKYYLFLSKAYTAKRNTDKSYKTLLKAQELVKNSKDLNAKIDVLLLIAIQYQQMELFNKSFEALNEVDLLCKNISDTNKQKYAWLGKSFAVKGMIYKAQANLEISLQKFFSAISNLEKAEQTVPNINNTSIVYYNIGYIYLNRNQFSTAEKYFRKSISYASKSNAKSLEAYALKGLAENYMLQNQNEKALEILKLAAEKSRDIGDLLLDEGIYKGLAENNLSTGNFEEYLKNNENYKSIKFQREQSELQSINSLIDDLEQKKKNQFKEMESKNWAFNLGIILLSIVVSLVLLMKSRSKLQKNKIVAKKLAKLMVSPGEKSI